VATAQTVHRGPNVASGDGPRGFTPTPDISPGSAPGEGASTAVADAVRAGSPGYRWAAAVVGHRAADLQLASGAPVWALGGYTGSDPHPTAPQFLAAAAQHQVHYLVFTAADINAPGQAGRIVRWAPNCLPADRTGHWLQVDLTAAAARTPSCAVQ
jgi:hypothetical protein